MVKRSVKVNNICPSLVQRSYTNDCPAYTPGSLDDHARDFAYIRKQSSAFVDKTDFIKHNINTACRQIITAPHHFGKSVNISMLKYFFEIEVNNETAEPITKADISKEPVTDTYNYKLFENLAVHRLHPDIMNNWFGRQPVIHLDFSLKSSINSYQDAYDHCLNVTRETFKQHSYLLNSTKLRYGKDSIIKRYCDDVEFQNMKHSGEKHYWSQDVSTLKKALFQHFGRQCIFLVDEYDAIFRASLASTDKNTFEKCRFLGVEMIDRITRFDTFFNDTAIVVLSGITGMAVYGTRDLCYLETDIRRFFGNNNYWSEELRGFHGFTQKEFDFLMNKYNIPADIRKQAAEYYGGYCSITNRDQKFYNPYSVTRFLQTKIIQPYWSNAEFFEKYQFMFDFESSDLIIKQLIFGRSLGILFEDKTRWDFMDLIDELYNKNEQIEHLQACLCNQGYLQIVETDFGRSAFVDVKVANEEMKIALINGLKKYYRTCGKFDWDLMTTCAQLFDDFDLTSDQDLHKLYSLLEKYCNGFFSMNEESVAKICSNNIGSESFIIEKYLRRLLYNIASLTKHKITIIDPKEYRNFEWARKEKPIEKITPDIKMCSDHGCIMIQAKYDITAQEALNQLILYSCRDETIKHVLIGLNLSKYKRLSMSAKIGDDFFTYGDKDGLKIENSTEMES